MKSTIGLIMRKSYNQHDDHIKTVTSLAENVILFSMSIPDEKDERFTDMVQIVSTDEKEVLKQIKNSISIYKIDSFITWQETDIILTAKANQLLSGDTHAVEMSTLSRNKANQRQFLKTYNIPSPLFYEIKNEEDIYQLKDSLQFPVIIKPTMAASSVSVSLVEDLDGLLKTFAEIKDIAELNKGLYYDSNYTELALIEEFLSGEEITIDGAIKNGQFLLGGIHNKNRMMGPHFEEDLYTLPYTGEDMNEILSICHAIVNNLGLTHSLFNVELRKDHAGQYKVVEFSVRISGGHVYRNIRDVHGIDLVAVHALSVLDAEESTIEKYAKRNTKIEKCTCIKFIYRQGIIEENNCESILNEPEFKQYYPLAKKGAQVNKAPLGFDVTGLLSLIADYKNEQDLEELKLKAEELDGKLNITLKQLDTSLV